LKEFSNRRILIAGGAGFVGSNLANALLRFSPKQIVIIDNLLSSEHASVPVVPEVTFIEGSITNDDVLKTVEDDFDYMFHLATYHGNQSSIHDPLADHEHNTLTTLKLYERIKGFRKLKKVVYSSAGCTVAEKTFGEASATMEDAPVSLYLDSPYQISKIVGELYSNYYYKQYSLPVVKARFQNVYGPGEVLGAGRWRGTAATVWRNVTPTFIYKACKRLPLIVENGGYATRDFIYVEDIVRGLLLCATAGAPGEVYNLASGVETSILELAVLINTLTQNSTAIEVGPKRSWDHSGKRFGSPEKSRRQLGFQAECRLQDGLEQTIEWTRSHMPFIDECIGRHAKHMAAVEGLRQDNSATSPVPQSVRLSGR
jgi:UDP-glucose 4-epimerase